MKSPFIFRHGTTPVRMPNVVPIEVYSRHTRQHFTDGLLIGFACGAGSGGVIAFLLFKLFP